MTTRSRRWTWTLHDYTGEEEEKLMNLDLRYLCYGREICPSTGKKHLQGFMILLNAKAMTAVKTWIGLSRIHLEKSLGTVEQNRAYCQKDGDFVEKGDPVEQGKRGDLDDFKAAMDDGMDEQQLANEHFKVWAKYPGLVKRYKNIQRESAKPVYDLASFDWSDSFMDYDWNKSLILYGEPGIGKTEFAKALIGEGFLLVSHLDQLGHFLPEKHTGIVFDDMSFRHLPRESQIHLVDTENERAIHIRYGVGIIPAGTKKVFTTNIHGGNIVDLDDGAIKRRVSIHHLIKL